MSDPQMPRQERDAFLADLHIAVMSVASDDERPPLTVPVWYGYEPGGEITFFTGTGGRRARKTRLLQTAGVVSLCVQREEFPYKYVTVEGTVVQIDRAPSIDQVLAIVRRYLPEEQAQAFATSELERPDSEFVLFTVRPDRWLSVDLSQETG